jgi:hypothetical protein
MTNSNEVMEQIRQISNWVLSLAMTRDCPLMTDDWAALVKYIEECEVLEKASRDLRSRLSDQLHSSISMATCDKD